MRVLLIKTSSMGDVIHTLPAITDVMQNAPQITLDWVVEKNFAPIAKWHPHVSRVIPIALREWRRHPFQKNTRIAWREFKAALHEYDYDMVLDAQGLIKSALIARLIPAKRVGYDFSSIREKFAACFYHRRITVTRDQHAITRLRTLFSQALNYGLPKTSPDFHLNLLHPATQQPTLFFIHGTTWDSKAWPIAYWKQLASLAQASGYRILMSGFHTEELAVANEIAESCEALTVMPGLSIAEMGALLSSVAGVVAVDTGFAHLAAALNIPTVSLYGATRADYTGTVGDRAIALSAQFPCSPCLKRTCVYKGEEHAVKPACYSALQPAWVWENLKRQMV